MLGWGPHGVPWPCSVENVEENRGVGVPWPCSVENVEENRGGGPVPRIFIFVFFSGETQHITPRAEADAAFHLWAGKKKKSRARQPLGLGSRGHFSGLENCYHWPVVQG